MHCVPQCNALMKVNRGTVRYQFLDVQPTLISNNDVVYVKYFSTKPASLDWIGAYSPANINISTSSPVKFAWCDESDSYLRNGSGEISFNFTNLRSNIAFYYFIGGINYKKPGASVVAKYPYYVNFRNYNEPLRARIVPTESYNVFKLLWSSAHSTKPVLRWGIESGLYDRLDYATTSKVRREDLCGSPANSTGFHELGFIHSALFKGMKILARKKVFYQFGDERTNDMSAEKVFHVPTLPGEQSVRAPTSVLLVSDFGRSTPDMSYTWNEGRAIRIRCKRKKKILNAVNKSVSSRRLIDRQSERNGSKRVRKGKESNSRCKVNGGKLGNGWFRNQTKPSVDSAFALGAEASSGKIDAVIHIGDIAYSHGYLAAWDFYLNLISPMAGSVLYLTTVGNHDSDWTDGTSAINKKSSGGECGVSALMVPMPYPATRHRPWWSYEIGLVHYIAISSEHDLFMGSEQYRWLELDLKSVDRRVTPWVLLGSHRALYINSAYDGGIHTDVGFMEWALPIIEPLMFKYKVNLAFYGHNHVVQRHSAVFNKTVVQKSTAQITKDGTIVHLQQDPQATVHMVIGTTGALFTKNFIDPFPAWNEMVIYEYGYARVTAKNESLLDWQWVQSATGRVLDHLLLTQKDPFLPFRRD